MPWSKAISRPYKTTQLSDLPRESSFQTNHSVAIQTDSSGADTEYSGSLPPKVCSPHISSGSGRVPWYFSQNRSYSPCIQTGSRRSRISRNTLRRPGWSAGTSPAYPHHPVSSDNPAPLQPWASRCGSPSPVPGAQPAATSWYIQRQMPGAAAPGRHTPICFVSSCTDPYEIN